MYIEPPLWLIDTLIGLPQIQLNKLQYINIHPFVLRNIFFTSWYILVVEISTYVPNLEIILNLTTI